MGSMSQSGRPGTSRHEAGSPPEVAGGPPHRVPGEPAERPGHDRVVVAVVDGSPESGAALRQAASQARQRNALLDIVCIVPAGTDGPASIMARVKLGEFTRHECPYGMGVPVRLRVEHGDPQTVLRRAAAESELLISGLPRPPEADDEPETSAEISAAPRRRRWIHAPIPTPPPDGASDPGTGPRTAARPTVTGRPRR